MCRRRFADLLSQTSTNASATSVQLAQVLVAKFLQPVARFVPVAPAFRPERRHITTIVHALVFAPLRLHVAMPAEPRYLDYVLEFKGFSPE